MINRQIVKNAGISIFSIFARKNHANQVTKVEIIGGIFHITSKIVCTFSEEQTHPRLSASRCSFKSVN